MTLLRLLFQNWQKIIRSRGFYKNLMVNIFLGFIVLYFAVILWILGLFLHRILVEIPIGKTPTEIFNGITLYIIFGGLLLRYLMQQLTTINVQSYQMLPIKHSTIVNYLLFSSLLNPINYILFFTIIPFAIRSISMDYGSITAFRFVLNFLFIVCFNSLTASLIKRKFGSNFWGFVGVILFFTVIIALEYFKIFSLFAISGTLFDFIVLKPYGIGLSLLAVAVVYLLNRLFFAKNIYAENFEKQAKTEKNYNSTHLSFLNRFGIIGDIMTLELKLIWRHKRTKNLLYMAVLFLFYGLIFYTNDMYADSYGLLFFAAMFMTGLITFLFGQWLISWNSSHFDAFMTRNFSIQAYIKANFYLMLAGNILCFVLTIPYFLFGEKIAILHISSFLYNSGVNTFLLTYFATYNTKRIDLSAKSALNYQGTTFKNFLVVIPLMFTPMIIVGVFSLFSMTNIALVVLSVLGIIGLLFQKQLITLCVNQFNSRKYALCEGFRQSE